MPTSRSKSASGRRARAIRADADSARAPARASSAGADPALDAVDSLRALIREMRRAGRDAELVGVHGAQLFALQKLAEAPATSLGELAERTFTDPSSVSVVVTRLVERGLATRTAASDDRRRVTIALTPAGRALVRRATPAAETRLLAAASALPERQVAALANGLRALARGLATEPDED